MKYKLTRQGVRDLDSIGPKKEKKVLPPTCSHARMRVHCPGMNGKGCGHYECPDCGLSWDDGFGGPQ